MTDFPFPADEIKNHRFHTLIQGTFELDEHRLRLRTEFGVIGLYPVDHSGNRALHAGRAHHQESPDAVVFAYGYPRVKDGCIHGMQLCSFHTGDKQPAKDSVAARFMPGQVFLCGRVKEATPNGGGPVTVRVKTRIPGAGDRRWDVQAFCLDHVRKQSKTLFHGWIAEGGKLFLKVEKEITPPGQKTRRSPVRKGPDRPHRSLLQ